MIYARAATVLFGFVLLPGIAACLVRGEPGGHLDALESRGRERFDERCARCHVPGFFTDFAYHNNGLDDRYPERDERVAWGRGRITRVAEDVGKYRTPTLRNVALTAPYMHDGRFTTLEEVLEHYRSGVRPSATLDPRLAKEGGIPLSDDDTTAIIAFLRTLTDESAVRLAQDRTAVASRAKRRGASITPAARASCLGGRSRPRPLPRPIRKTRPSTATCVDRERSNEARGTGDQPGVQVGWAVKRPSTNPMW